MSGYSIRSNRALTVKEIRDFFNRLDERFDDDYLAFDFHDSGDRLVTGLHSAGLRFHDGPHEVSTSTMKNPRIVNDDE